MAFRCSMGGSSSKDFEQMLSRSAGVLYLQVLAICSAETDAEGARQEVLASHLVFVRCHRR